MEICALQNDNINETGGWVEAVRRGAAVLVTLSEGREEWEGHS